MKKLTYLLLPGVLFACSGEEASTSNNSDDKTLTEEVTDNIIDELFDDDSEAGADFVAYADVKRFSNDATLNFETFTFNDVFEFSFPEVPEWDVKELFDDYGYDKYTISKVFEGSVYEIIVEDYSKDDKKEIDDMAVYMNHSSMWEFAGGDLQQNSDVTLPNGYQAKYATYSWALDDKDYMEDLITVGLDKHIVYFRVYSRPNYETASKLNEFISAFKVL